MPESKAFIDTNILLYLLSADTDKADRAEKIVRAGGLISVQVLNEMANVARRKLAMSWMEINEMLTLIRSICVAAALLGGCETLYSADMQDGLLIDNHLRICNPFTIQASSKD